MTIAERIRLYRQQKGFSQAELADKAQVNNKSLSRYELGSSIPPADVLKNIADALGVSTDALLNDETVTIKDKELMQKFEVIRINYLNFIATMTQKTTRQQWLSTDDNDRARLVNFMTTHCLRPAGHKVFKILMTRLARRSTVKLLMVTLAKPLRIQRKLSQITRSKVTSWHLTT